MQALALRRVQAEVQHAWALFSCGRHDGCAAHMQGGTIMYCDRGSDEKSHGILREKTISAEARLLDALRFQNSNNAATSRNLGVRGCGRAPLTARALPRKDNTAALTTPRDR